MIIGLVATWASAAVLIENVGGPAAAAAGILLAVLLPGWVVAEAALKPKNASPEYWIVCAVGASLVITVLVGAIGTATGDLTRSAMGWCWLAATSLAALGAVTGNTREDLAAPSLGRPVAELGEVGSDVRDFGSAVRGAGFTIEDACVEAAPTCDVAPFLIPPTVSVVICAYTEARWLELNRAVASVFDQTIAPHEVVVVIDHNPELLARAKDEFSRAVVVPNVQRAGLPGARNSGVLATTGEVVAFLDDDAAAGAKWLEELVRGYSQDSILGVGGRIEPLWATGRPRWFPEEFNWVVGCTYRGIPHVPARVRNLIGANMSMRRLVFDAVGGFRQELGRLEETDLCIRAQVMFPQGIWLYWPAALVSHSVTAERASWPFFKARCLAEGKAKATMVTLTGRTEGLQAERRYVRRVLPSGVVREVLDPTLLRRGGPSRAGAILVGLSYTVAGYALASVRLRGRAKEGVIDLPRRGANP